MSTMNTNLCMLWWIWCTVDYTIWTIDIQIHAIADRFDFWWLDEFAYRTWTNILFTLFEQSIRTVNKECLFHLRQWCTTQKWAVIIIHYFSTDHNYKSKENVTWLTGDDIIMNIFVPILTRFLCLDVHLIYLTEPWMVKSLLNFTLLSSQ